MGTLHQAYDKVDHSEALKFSTLVSFSGRRGAPTSQQHHQKVGITAEKRRRESDEVFVDSDCGLSKSEHNNEGTNAQWGV